jgi:F-type H+-transporting ATPase subunit gamma
MANRRVLVKRRKAARNIRKITRTMQLISTARFQSAFSAAVAGRPYTDKLAELVGNLAQAAKGLDHPLLQVPEEERSSALVVLTSSRGLCGGYNTNVLRSTIEHVDEKAAAGVDTELQVVGKKGIGYLRYLGRKMAEEITTIGDQPRFEEVEPIANSLMERFIAGELDSVWISYMKFISPGKQRPVVECLLPLSPEEALGSAEEKDGAEVQYEFSPAPQELLQELLPATVRVRFYQAFMDATVSEHVARMVAMKAATDAAEDMIKRLTAQYNRARQTQITMELLDIVGGANALA